MSTLPQEQIDDAHKLIQDGTVFLYEIVTTAGHLYFKADNSVTWQGNLYTGTAIKLDDVVQSVDGEKARPTLTLANPMGVFSALQTTGAFDNAVVYERRVLRTHLENDDNIFRQRQWKVRMVTAMNRLSISLQLRDTLDGPRFLLPGRQYTPPDFPSVSV